MSGFVAPASLPTAARAHATPIERVASRPARPARGSKPQRASRPAPHVPPQSEFLGAPVLFQASASARRNAAAVPAGPVCEKKGGKAKAGSGDEDRAAAVPELEDWLKSRKVPKQNVRIVETELDGLGCVAAKDVGQGEVLISIPYTSVITYETVMESELGEALENVSEWTALALWLIHERFANPRSEWAPYIRMLPETVPSTLSWSEEELKELRGSPVLFRTRERKKAIADEFSVLQERLFAAYPDLFPKEAFTRENFEWAFSIMLSRFTFLPELRGGAGQLALVPVGDCANHRADARGKLEYDEDTESVVLVADRPYKADQPVHVNYGELSNSELMLNYGFAIPENPLDFLEITLSVGFDALAEFKTKYLQKYGLNPVQAFPVYADRMPDQLYAFQRLVKLKGEELDRFGDQIFQNMQKVVSPMNEYEALQSLMELCRLTIQEYRTTEEDDVMLLNDPACTGKNRAAAVLRRGEKRILNKAINAIRMKLAPIRGLEKVDSGPDPAEYFGGWVKVLDFFEGKNKK